MFRHGRSVVLACGAVALLASAAVLSAATAASAATAPAGAAKATVSPAKEAKIRELMQVTGAAQMSTSIVAQLMASFRQAAPQVPAAFWDEFMKEVKPAQFVEMVVPIYAKHFTEEDIDGLLAFYRTPLGRKLVKEMGPTMTECVAAGQAWGRQVGERAMARAKQKGYLPAS